MGRNATYKLITGHRGRIKGISDKVKDAIEAKACIICGESFTRKLYSSGRFEEWARFYARKTCTKKCKRVLLKGEGNPNWKGGTPKCIDCGEHTAWYPSKSKTKRNHQKHCLRCWKAILETRGHIQKNKDSCTHTKIM